MTTTENDLPAWLYDCCHYCNQERPPLYWKLSATRPYHWSPDTPAASLGLFCSLECATLEPTATLADAEDVAGCIEPDDWHADDIWERLLDAYPDPIPVSESSATETPKRRFIRR